MIEVERKYDVPAGFVLPPLDRPGWVIADGGTVHLSATYYDTADLALAQAKKSLRRRTGGNDDGWHLKQRRGDEREEIQVALEESGVVPAKLAALVTAETAGARLAPVVLLETTRTIRTVSAADGTPLVEVVDDLVRSRRLGAGTADEPPQQWRELEAELLTAGQEVALVEVGHMLIAAGATPSGHASKLAQALGRSASP